MTTKLLELAHSNAVRGIEIFATGTHNGHTFDEKDIDDMVAAFNKLDFKPAVKIGHTQHQKGAPSYGWVTNLTKVVKDGKAKLLADFESMHDSVVAALRDRRYDRVSSEIYFDLKRGDSTFRRALRAVALLGAEVPAVAGLVPLHKIEFAEADGSQVSFADAELSVPHEALLKSLETRLAGIIETNQENDDMARKNAAKIAQLAEEVKELKAKMEKETDEGMKKAHAKKCSELEERILDLEIEDEEADADTAKKLAEQAEALAAEKAKREALEKQVAQFAAKDRQREVEAKVAGIAIPALRPAFTALFNDALQRAEGTTVEVFSTDKDGKTSSEKMSPVAVLDSVVAQLNENAKKVFRQFSAPGDIERPELIDDAGAEVNKRVRKLQEADKALSYEDALSRVLAADGDLAKKYEEQTSGIAS